MTYSMLIVRNFSDTSFKPSPSVWLVTEPRTNNMWYNKLTKISNIANMIENINTTLAVSNDGVCLSLRYDQKANPPFVLNSMDCKARRSTICKIESPEKSFPQKPPKFPCITQTRREKRDAKGRYIGNIPIF